MELEKLFCEIDDFCLIFEESFQSKAIASHKQLRQRKSQLCLSEIMTIMSTFIILVIEISLMLYLN